MKISELKFAIREMIVSELNEAAYEYETPSGKRTGEFRSDTEAKGFDQRNPNVSGIKKLEEDALNELAQIVGDLQAAIEKVIDQNKDAEMKDLRKAIRTDDDVIAALKDLEAQDKNSDLAGNQLNRFILKTKGELIPQQRGRKADPNKPVKEPKEKGVPGRPKGSTKSNDALAFTMGGNVSISGKNVSPAEKKKAVRAAEKNKPIELLKIKDIAVIDTEINDLASELKSKIPTAKQISSKGDDSRYTEEEAAFMNDLKSKSERLKQLKATREKLQTKSIRRQDRNIDITNADLD